MEIRWYDEDYNKQFADIDQHKFVALLQKRLNKPPKQGELFNKILNECLYHSLIKVYAPAEYTPNSFELRGFDL